jgi:16S rRNA (adenine1518-N6/adenine1519-N6)-dimethyltransferase
VKAKKRLGQHFLHEAGVLARIAAAVRPHPGETLMEIGPGKGALTRLLAAKHTPLVVVEADGELIAPLKAEFPQVDVIHADVLGFGCQAEYWCGNLPYNISSPIFFKLLEFRDKVREAVFMVQKEVARRLSAPPGNKDYGILSVLLGRYFQIEYLFAVKPGAFVPPPKVDSAVVRLRRNDVLPDGYRALKTVVKAAFNQRRKTVHNALKSAGFSFHVPEEMRGLRAENLSVEEFVRLAGALPAVYGDLKNEE